MLYPRIIPCLLIKDRGLVKTVQFSSPKYVGDPINAVKIFNEKEVDELIVLDIDSTVKGVEPDYKMVENLAAECRMPLCYGGGIKTVAQAQKIFTLGVEKIAISSIALEKPELVSEIAERVGNQSVVVVLDLKKNLKTNLYEIKTHNGLKSTNKNFLSFIKELEKLGAGEIVINSIDRDGKMEGYDLELIKKVKETLTIPITVLGGAGKLKDISNLISIYPIIGAAAGSLFVFKGIFKAVLINYPNKDEKEVLFLNK